MGIIVSQDWTKFRNLESLPQKAGVSRDKLGLLVAKELADNALDHSNDCEVGYVEPNGFYVKDDGEGIEPSLLADLFSINRPFMSSKLLRMPTRGALGNGLRVVCGAIISTGGSLHVSTRGKKYHIQFQSDGTSKAKVIGEYTDLGTRIDIQFGHTLKVDLSWAKSAIHYNRGTSYKGRTSGYWYTSETFYELCQSSTRSVRELVSEFDSCTGTKAGKVSADFKHRLSNTLTFNESEQLLSKIRENSKQVNPTRLGGIEEMEGFSYYKTNGTFTVPSGRGRFDAEIPFVVEAWVDYQQEKAIDFLINKSPMTGQMNLFHYKKELTLAGCGLHEDIKMKPAHVVVNILTPYMPIVSDGKEPDLKPMKNEVVQAIRKAANRAKGNMPREKSKSQKDIIMENLQSAINKASGDGAFPFSLRQLYYAIRPFVISKLNKQLEYGYFCNVMTDYENEHGDIPKLYRDNRGVLYHPHIGQEIPIGTLTVQNYQRPDWTFNKILYSEKEGLFPLLKEAKFPERYDCALVTSKGYASRAVKDLLDMLGESDEEIQFFCIHDADAAGTKIYETLVEATKARPERKVKVINLGLDPEEAMQMNLEIECLERSKDVKAVASYVPKKWKHWLQTNRIELNAMTSEQFVHWLETKIAQYDRGKVIPNQEILADSFEQTVLQRVKDDVLNKILQEAGYEQQIEQRMKELSPILRDCQEQLNEEVNQGLNHHCEQSWREIVASIGKQVEL